MKITYPKSNDSFSPCKSKEERRLYDDMILLMNVIPQDKKQIKEAEDWREHEEAQTHRNFLERHKAELIKVMEQLVAMRPDAYSFTL